MDTSKRGTSAGDSPASNRPGEDAGGDSSIFSAHMRGRTTALWVVWFFVNLAYYGAFTWMPTLLYLQGHSLVKSFEFTLMMTLAQLPGYAAAAWLIEKWGRRLTLSVFLCGSAVSAILFGLQSGATGIIVTGLLLSFFNLGAWGALYAIGPEIYPTAMRPSGRCGRALDRPDNSGVGVYSIGLHYFRRVILHRGCWCCGSAGATQPGHGGVSGVLREYNDKPLATTS